MDMTYCVDKLRIAPRRHKPANEVPCYWADVDWDVYELRASLREIKHKGEASEAIPLEETFAILAEKWKRETRYSSATDDMVLDPAYLSIIGLGPAVVPLLLRELQKRPDHWVWALKAITRQDPVPPEHIGNIRKMTELWIEWGKQQGYL